MSIIRITDFSAPELDIFARASEAQLLNREHPENGLFIAESPIVISRALDAGYQPVSVFVEDRHIETQARDILLRCEDIPIYTAEFDVLTQITGFKLTRGMLCAMRRPPLQSTETVCRNARRIAVLENVMNPTNVGAIFRSAAALNIDAVLLTPTCSDPLYRRAIRVSMGTVFQIPWAYMEDNWLQSLRSIGFRTAAMALSDSAVSIRNESLLAEEKLAIILGTEGEGLTPETIAASDYVVKIPMSRGVDSLNVAAASAVAFWQIAGES